MTFRNLFQQMHGASAPFTVFALLRQTSHTRDKQAVREAITALSNAIARQRVGRALSAARVLLLLLDASAAIEQIQRHGLLRLSRWDFVVTVIEPLVSDWIAHAHNYGLSSQAVKYLRSVQALCTLADPMRSLYLSIVHRLRTEKYCVIKSLLAEVDAAFTAAVPVDVGDGEQREVTPEELAEAFSYLLGTFHAQCGGMKVAQLGLIDPESGYDPRSLKLLADALAVCRYREAEVLLDGFPYEAERLNAEVRISAIDPALERSVRLGYIQYQLQGYVHDQNEHEARAAAEDASLLTFADRFFETFGNMACTMRTSIAPRYTLQIPLEGPAAEFFKMDDLLVEDMSFCERLGWEDYIAPTAVPTLRVAGKVTVLDLLKVQRLFRFIHHGLKRALDKHPTVGDRAGLYRASCLPVFPRERMLAMIGLAVGQDKAAEVLELLTGDPSLPTFDIQYSPVLAAGDYYMVSLAIVASANLPRNVLSRTKRRLIPPAPGQADPMQATLAQALRVAGFLVREEVYLTSGTDRLEVDVLAWRAGHLFVFECKNTYHPCNVYEMRNTYDAMEGAARQLTKRQRWLIDLAHQKALFASLGWSVLGAARVHTCIALGNRVFNGYDFAGHPVRQVHELLNVLQRGYIELQNGNRVRFWQRPAFSVDDLIVYLAGATTHADMHASMEPAFIITPVGPMRLVGASYVLDATLLRDTIIARYPPVPVLSAAKHLNHGAVLGAHC